MTYASVASPYPMMRGTRRRARRGGISSMTVLSAIAIGVGAGVGVYVVTAQRPEAPNIVVVPAQAVRDIPAVPRSTGPVAKTFEALFDPRTLVGGAPMRFADSAPMSAAFAWAEPEKPADTAVAQAEVPDLKSVTPPAAGQISTPAAVQVASAEPVPADDASDEAWAPPEFPPLPPASPLLRTAPMPMPRPAGLADDARPQPRRVGTAVAQLDRAPPQRADGRNILEKLFSPPPSSGPMLAYANPEDGSLGGGPFGSSPISDRYTAVYDISAHTVYLPDGTRLEAHSGLGFRQDDPRYVRDRNVGPTPPTTYELTPREALFHGVPALRLNPINGGTYGRDGLLAHTYMLGPSGGSNGCVSFRNYNAFLQAFRRGDIRRLTVVARLG